MTNTADTDFPRYFEDADDLASCSLGGYESEESRRSMCATPTPDEFSTKIDLSVVDEFCRGLGVDVHNLMGQDITMPSFLSSRISNGHEKGSFLVTNLRPIISQCLLWRKELPMVDPLYAVKCLPDKVVLKVLAALGCGFDCATQGEIQMVLEEGIFDAKIASATSIGGASTGAASTAGAGGVAAEPSAALNNSELLSLAGSRIVYSQPAKMKNHIEYAIEHNVRLTVFDGEDELQKLASLKGHEHLHLLLRIETDDKHSVCRFSNKFGTCLEEVPHLLETAQYLGMHVAGVSFHVGSGCGDANAYVTALTHARWVFDVADKLGLPPMHVVDIGGGFPGDCGGYGGPGMPTFQDLAASIRAGIAIFADGFTRPLQTVRFIAEPGRYFVSACTTVVTKVYARRGGKNRYQALYVDDGVYGSFNNIVYDHATPVPLKLASVLRNEAERRQIGIGKYPAATATSASASAAVGGASRKQQSSIVVKEPGHEEEQLPMQHYEGDERIPTAVFGPTCDGLDQMCSLDDTALPRCEEGDWLVWENMGAYTHTASFDFNGYTHVPQRTYCLL